MRYKILVFGLATFITTQTLFGQTKIESNQGISFYEIVKNREQFLDSSEHKEIAPPTIIKENVFKRWEWFWKYRVDQKGGFTKYGESMKDYSRMSSIRFNAKAASSIAWNPVGPISAPPPWPSTECPHRSSSTGVTQPKCIWTDGTDTYVGLSGGGCWKRDNINNTWENLTKDYMILGVRDIEVDDQGKIYLATGFDGQSGSRHTFDAFGSGIVYSIDGGNTWVTDKMTSIPTEDLYMNKIIIHPTNRDIVYALSRKTVYKTTDGGLTWTDMNAPTLSNSDIYTGMVMKENDPEALFICSAGIEFNMGLDQVHGSIYGTFDGGSTWDPVNLATNLKYTSDDPIFISLATTAADEDAIYVVYSKELVNNNRNTSYSTLEKSIDDGESWLTLVDNKSLFAATYMMHNLTVSPVDSNYILVGSVSQYKYTISPTSNYWSSYASGLHADLRDYYFHETGGSVDIYQANDAGINISIDLGLTWTDISEGLHGSLFYGIETSETNPDLLLGGVGDCGTHYFDGSSWKNMCLEGDGGTCLINKFDVTNMFGQTNAGIFYTKNGGVDWDFTGEVMSDYNKPMIQHPNEDKIFFATREGGWWHYVKYTTDQGDNFTTYYNPKTDGTGDNRISAMAISKSDPDYFYIGMTDYTTDPDPNGYYLYEANLVRREPGDGGSWVWKDITPNLGPILFEAPLITDIEVHPQYPDIVWISFCGLSDGNKVFYTIDGGINWMNISYNLYNLPVMGLEYDFDNQVLYLANDVGVFSMEDGSSSWSRMGNFPHAIATDIKLNRKSGKLYASTWGNGLWETSIPGHCYEGSWESITTTEIWTTDKEMCENLAVTYGGSLTVKSNLVMPFEGTIKVSYSSELIIDGGIIENANIEVETGGKVVLKDGAILKLAYGDDLDVGSGCTFEMEDEDVQIIYE